jgi:hypothetical protein
MKEDIILNGVSISELKKQKQAIQRDAAKFIAETTNSVKVIVDKIVESEDKSEIETLSGKALEMLENINVVSSVSGVEYFFEYRNEYGDYSHSDIASCRLEEKLDEFDVSWKDKKGLEKMFDLYNIFQNMETDVAAWNTSNC